MTPLHAFFPAIALAGGAVSKTGVGAKIIGGVKSALGGKRSHVSVTFYDIYGKIQHTNTEAERDAFLAKQRAAKQKLVASPGGHQPGGYGLTIPKVSANGVLFIAAVAAFLIWRARR